jgi:GDPmannose 4,6-dehydratase
MSQKVAIIVWAWWQDGTILTKLLSARWYGVIAVHRDHTSYIDIEGWRTDIDVLNPQDAEYLIEKFLPVQLYYLAAYHHSSEETTPDDAILFHKSREVHVDGYLNFLNAVARRSPGTRICYASSCLIYEGSTTEVQSEDTLPVPNSPYAITKLEGMHVGNWYMKKHDLRILNAILYNHESEFRWQKFLSMKVILGAIAIAQWKQKELILWDLSTKIDQWSAWDYMENMISLLEEGSTWDYIFSSWEQHTIQDMVEIVFWHLGLDWRGYIKVDMGIVKRKTWTLFWNPAKLKDSVEWYKSSSFQEMIVRTINTLC